MNYSKLTSVFIALKAITTSESFNSEHNIKTQQEEYIKDVEKYLGFDFINISEEIIEGIFKKAEEIGMAVNPFLVIEKYDDKYILIWYLNKTHFIQVLDRGSSFKGTDLCAVCEGVINKEGADYPFENRTISPDKTFLVSHPELHNMLDYNYSVNQPDLAMMTLLLDGNSMVAHEFINRGFPKYGNSFEECEPEYFENNPDFKKYSTPTKAEWDSNIFIQIKD